MRLMGMAGQLAAAATLIVSAGVRMAIEGAPQANSAPPPPRTQLSPALQNQQIQEQTGLENPWDVRSLLASLSKDDDQLGPVLNQLNPQQWSNQKGAPTTYILLLQTAQQQWRDLVVSTKLLSQKTESLPLALDLYFRLESLDVPARTLADGARKYGDRQTAEKLAQLLANNFQKRESLRNYLRDLSISTEQNFKIADEEAQRCRGMISKEPPPKKTRK